MDELRDYRFYAEDMLHLSSVAVNHIFDRFSQSIITGETMKISEQVTKIIQAMQHRPFNPKSVEYEKFLRIYLNEIEQIEKKSPFLDFTVEREYFNNELTLIR